MPEQPYFAKKRWVPLSILSHAFRQQSKYPEGIRAKILEGMSEIARPRRGDLWVLTDDAVNYILASDYLDSADKAHGLGLMGLIRSDIDLMLPELKMLGFWNEEYSPENQRLLLKLIDDPPPVDVWEMSTLNVIIKRQGFDGDRLHAWYQRFQYLCKRPRGLLRDLERLPYQSVDPVDFMRDLEAIADSEIAKARSLVDEGWTVTPLGTTYIRNKIALLTGSYKKQEPVTQPSFSQAV